MNCGRSSSVEWKLPKLQRRVRFPSPAPLPPGRAPGGFVMPTSGPRSAECGGNRYKTRPAHPVRRPPGTKLAPHAQNLPIWRVLPMQGEFYPVFITNKPHRANFFPHTPSATTGTTETTPQHNTRNHAMKYYSPTLHTQHHTMKHLPPQHTINNQNSPIFTMQGRSFFHNTHHTPTPGRHFFQPTGPGPHQTQAAHNSTTTGAQHCEPAGTNRRPERNCPRHHLDSGARPQKSRT